MSSRVLAALFPEFGARAGLVLDTYLTGDTEKIALLQQGLHHVAAALKKEGVDQIIDETGQPVPTQLDEIRLHVVALQGVFSDDYLSAAE